MSTKDLKTRKKRTKLVQPTLPKNWEELPLVMVAKALQVLPRFKEEHSYISYNISSTATEARDKFETGRTQPYEITLTQKHKNCLIKVHIKWLYENEKRCAIVLRVPITNTYYPNGQYSNPKATKSRYLEGVIERVEEALTVGRAKIDESIVAEQKGEQRIKESKEFHKQLCEELGVELSNPTPYEPPFKYLYKQGNQFWMRFKKIDTELLEVSSIGGSFTIEELKQFIKIVGGNPRAIASRLVGKQ